MTDPKPTRAPLPVWGKIICTLGLLYVSFYIELVLFVLCAFLDMGGVRASILLLMLLPVLALALIWLPKRKRILAALGGTAAAMVAAAIVIFVISMFIAAYQNSLVIDTSPAIDVNEYLPFDEDSKIVKMRSELLQFTSDPPVIDGAAALFPVYSAFVNATYPEGTALTEDGPFRYNNTPGGYRALAERRTDLFIGVYPSQEQIEYAEENGTHFRFQPIGYDAFVFFVHKDNPIESLTADEIRAIYAGEITNWKELGGLDEEIVAYQRNAGSGSQSMLLRFMGDQEPMAAPSTTVNTMGGIIEEVADYKSVTASIGFSFRFYVEGIIQNPDIKMIAIDGVLPTAENVRNESYPIRTPFYAVTYEENDNPNTAALIDWILSAEGQFIIEESGYIGVGTKE